MDKKKKDGNGGIKLETGTYTEAGFLIIDDLVVSSVLCMYFLQRLGNATVEQISEKIEAKSARINVHLLTQTLEALRAR